MYTAHYTRKSSASYYFLLIYLNEGIISNKRLILNFSEHPL